MTITTPLAVQTNGSRCRRDANQGVINEMLPKPLVIQLRHEFQRADYVELYVFDNVPQ